MSSQLIGTLYTLSIYLSAPKQLRRHLPNPFRELPCIIELSSVQPGPILPTKERERTQQEETLYCVLGWGGGEGVYYILIEMTQLTIRLGAKYFWCFLERK